MNDKSLRFELLKRMSCHLFDLGSYLVSQLVEVGAECMLNVLCSFLVAIDNIVI